MNELSDRIYRDFSAGQKISIGKEKKNMFSFVLNYKEIAYAIYCILGRGGSYTKNIIKALMVGVI